MFVTDIGNIESNDFFEHSVVVLTVPAQQRSSDLVRCNEPG